MKRFFNWLADRISPQKASPQSGPKQAAPRVIPKKAPIKQAVPRSQPEYVEFDSKVDGQIDDAGPGKNVLKRNKYIREETGTHETLSILDDSVGNNTRMPNCFPFSVIETRTRSAHVPCP